MIRSRVVLPVLLCLLVAFSSNAVAATKYVVKQDPEAVAVAKAAFDAMGGSDAVAGYKDSVSSGSVTIYSGGDPVSYTITLKSKGLRATRVELQLPKGTNTRIVNQGQAVIVRPDGTVNGLDSNNTFYEHVNQVPLLSLLSEYPTQSVNLLYIGVQNVQDQSEDVIEVDYIPSDDPITGEMFASMSRTLFFINQSTKLVDKIQSNTLLEGDAKNSVTEEVYLADYRSVNGLMIPFHQTLFTDGKMFEDLKLSSVELNVGLPDTDFALPKAR